MICSCFHLFDVIHDLIETKASLIRITRELIEDFVNDGVIYAEIRTTPREYTVDGYLSEKDGIDVILNTIKEMEREYGKERAEASEKIIKKNEEIERRIKEYREKLISSNV